jgi:hypothetical protein
MVLARPAADSRASSGASFRSAALTRDGLLAETALFGVTVAAGIGALRLTTAPGSTRTVLPVLAVIVTGHIGVSLVGRARGLRGRGALSLLAGVVLTALVCVWLTIPSRTRDGLPTATTVRGIGDLFDHAGALIRSKPTPLPPTAGVLLCFMAGAAWSRSCPVTCGAWPGRTEVILEPRPSVCFRASGSSGIRRC